MQEFLLLKEFRTIWQIHKYMLSNFDKCYQIKVDIKVANKEKRALKKFIKPWQHSEADLNLQNLRYFALMNLIPFVEKSNGSFNF